MIRSALVLVLVVGCGSSQPHTGDDVLDAAADSTGTDVPAGALVLPPLDAKLDYQLGGAYTPPAGVKIVSRDRTASPGAGLYNICYLNGFQIQPDELTMWMAQYPDLLLRDAANALVIDTDWNEVVIDTSTPAKRTELAAIVKTWIDGCKQAGFAAIEIDNLDSYARSKGLLVPDNNVAAVRLMADAAHAAGIPIAQKNSSELVPRKAEMTTDFVVAEECNRYTECDAYRAGYGDHVLVIEYRRQDFTAGCAAYPALSIVLRDLNLVTPADAAYVYDGC